MERLVVKNFLLLQDVDIEIKKYNFLLGPQASGKSVLAKILYFIYDIPSIIRGGIIDDIYGEEILDKIKEKFKEIFPDNYWGAGNFEIVYQIDNLTIRLESKENKNKNKNFTISFNKKHEKIINDILDIVRMSKQNIRTKSLDEIVNLKTHSIERNMQTLRDYLSSDSSISLFFDKSGSQFIPSSRCVYSILADKPATNAATFSNDYILNQFGQMYENLKDIYNHMVDGTELGKEFKLRSERILKGKYIHEKKQDYITINNKKINVKYVSSGQQEALPLLVILGIYFSVYFSIKEDRLFFIEEPEAHLFPEAQVEIMSLLSLVGYEGNMSYFITTHSPYLLSVLNNFLYGTKLMDDNLITLEKYKEITNGARPIHTNQVNAFTLKDGVSLSLMDKDGVFIDSNVLDSASNVINEMYDSFIDQKL